MTNTGPLISLIVPLYNEEENVPGLIDHLQRVAEANPGFRFECIAVDDGSSDRTYQLLSAAETNLPTSIVRLSRNFGSHYAISAGLTFADGEAAVILGADQQEPVELVASFIEAWKDGAEIVWGVRRSRVISRGPAAWLSKTFSRLLNRYSELPSYPAEGPSGVLIARPVIDVVNQFKERHRNLLGLIAWAGYKQDVVEYDQLPRAAGETKWTKGKLLKLAFDSFVQFSHTPIRFAGVLGLAISGLGFLYAAFISVRALLGAGAPEGWTTVIVVVTVLGGLQLVVLSVFGEYLWRATDEARNRPVFVVRDVLRPSDAVHRRDNSDPIA